MAHANYYKAFSFGRLINEAKQLKRTKTRG